MQKTYDPKELEQEIYQTWENSHCFKASGKGKPYSIVIPPPNITGTLHMGHGFQYSLMDALIRYHRMQGFNTLWQVGSDHAGISTQMVVERELGKQDIRRHDLGRDKFIEKVWEWREQSGNTITQQMRRMGCSVDWERERFTMDEGLSNAVSDVFIKLYDEGLIYRGKRLVNWDPKFQTAISDVEVLSNEEDGFMWHFSYPLSDGSGHMTIATTRPETMLGDSAVAVHPEDERYKNLIGKTLQLPLCDREIPIIADDYVDPEFGTGCVKITPAHDFNDHEVGKRHDLPLINILNPDATLNDDVPGSYRGLDRFVARKKIVTDLKELGLLAKIDDHKLMVPRGDRSNEIIEPYMTDQWFVNAKELAQPAIRAVEEGKIKFVPENWSKTYYQWMYNIEDWCISRQLWWGHRIPAWYDDNNNIYVGEDEAAVREKYQLSPDLQLHQDSDVLDTWFSSGLWPFSTLGWPEATAEFKELYPTSVLVTGFDIIFYWVARMIMFGLKFTGEVPFHEVYVTGLIRDAEGQKMSKTKGNVLDPIDLIDGVDLETLIQKRTAGLMQLHMHDKIIKATKKQFPEGINSYGTDALRFTYCALASTGRNVRFDINRIEGYRNFCNKLWNAARYVLMNTEDKDNGVNAKNINFSLADRWINSRLQQTVNEVHRHFKQYRFDLIANCIYDFIWHAYCDWYLELSKPVLTGNADEATQRGNRYTLLAVLESTLKLLHPLMPFITEAIWQQVAPLLEKPGDTIMLQSYPEASQENIDDKAETEMAWLQQVITGIRTIRSEMNISPAKTVPLLLHKWQDSDKQLFETHRDYLMALAKVENIELLATDADLPPAATALVGELELLIPMAGLIDKDAEVQRLDKEIEKIQKDLTKCEAKLQNPKFVDKAPADVVAQERERVADFQKAISKLQERAEQMRIL